MRRSFALPLAICTAFVVLVAGQSAADAAGSLRTTYVYPTAEAGARVDTYFGTRVADPYRWLENPRAARTKAWVRAESALSSAYLSSLPSRPERSTQLTSLYSYDRIEAPFEQDGKLFWLERRAGKDQNSLYIANGRNGVPRTLINGERLSADGTSSISDWNPSPNNEFVAWTASDSGSDWQTIRIRSVRTGRDLSERLHWVKFSWMAWLPDSSGFYYSRFPKPEDPLESANTNHELYFHMVGTPQSEDRLAFADPEHPDRTVSGFILDGTNTLWIYQSDSAAPGNYLYYQRLDSPRAPIVSLFDAGDAEYYPLAMKGSKVWVQTTLDAPRRRVVRIDLTAPGRRNWTTVVPQQPEPMEWSYAAGKQIVSVYLKDATNRLRIYDLNGRQTSSPVLPGLGAVSGFAGGPEGRTYYAFTSYGAPRTVMELNTHTGVSTVWRAPKTPFDASQVVTEQVFLTSKDGTRVPVFIVHRADVTPDGFNATLLYGYGGFGVSITPAYLPYAAAWVQSGGVYVEATIRGGGEYGESWHLAGSGLNKQNSFDDFISAAEWLIASKWTSPDRLAIKGESNGGLLVATALTQRPDLFGAALADVAVTDMLRYQNFTIGAQWGDEYGRSDDGPRMFRYLLGYSPLHNIHPGTSYPATLVTTGDHDDRVVPAHSYKFAATLQASNAGPNPIIVSIATNAGHGGSGSIDSTISDYADELAFLDANLGIAPVVPTPVFTSR